MSQLMFWNKQNNNTNNNNSNNNNNNNNNKDSTTNGPSNDAKNGKRNWLHAPDALLNGHVVYLVKFFGNLPVDQPKGIDVVKDAIRKLQFAQEMKKAETGTQEKCKKVEITISVDGVAVQEPRTQKILHQFPLHNISYCADEKGVKKFFSFIAKTLSPLVGSNGSGSLNSSGDSTNGNSNEELHECFVFISNKLASDITLTIGQAFDLAYRKYISSAEKTDLGKAQQQISDLQKIIAIYKNRLRELSLKVPKSELDSIIYKMGLNDILDVPSDNGAALSNGNMINNDHKPLIDTNNLNHQSKLSSTSTTTTSSFVPMVPPRNNIPSQNTHKSNSQKMDELLLNSDSDSDFDPRAEELNNIGGKNSNSDLFGGFEPLKPSSNGQQQQQLLNNHFTNELHAVTPPLLAPPPKVSATRRSTSVSSSNNNNNNNSSVTDGHRDLFDSDPFDINRSAFKIVSVDDFSLESLDPLRK